MNAKLLTITVCFLGVSLLTAGCRPGQLSAPTVTPMPSATPALPPTSTPIPGIEASVDVDGMKVRVTAVTESQQIGLLQAEPGFRLADVQIEVEQGVTSQISAWTVTMQDKEGNTYEPIIVSARGDGPGSKVSWIFAIPNTVQDLSLTLPNNISVDLSPLMQK